ncbi:MAG: hypothetical protein ACFB9M_07325 [Myxococcota bacterium]
MTAWAVLVCAAWGTPSAVRVFIEAEDPKTYETIRSRLVGHLLDVERPVEVSRSSCPSEADRAPPRTGLLACVRPSPSGLRLEVLGLQQVLRQTFEGSLSVASESLAISVASIVDASEVPAPTASDSTRAVGSAVSPARSRRNLAFFQVGATADGLGVYPWLGVGWRYAWRLAFIQLDAAMGWATIEPEEGVEIGLIRWTGSLATGVGLQRRNWGARAGAFVGGVGLHRSTAATGAVAPTEDRIQGSVMFGPVAGLSWYPSRSTTLGLVVRGEVVPANLRLVLDEGMDTRRLDTSWPVQVSGGAHFGLRF